LLYAKYYAGGCWNDDLGLLRFYHDRRGVTALEYALIGGLIMVVIVAGVTAYATSLGAWFTMISGRMAGI
jgi:Flp pilus assembly pilin Flp